MRTTPQMNPTGPYERRWLTALLFIGPALLLVACTIYGITEVHSSTDTYIGLAGGRSILESTDGFPIADTFSYTFYGKPWINQNWLTHVWQYWLYSTFGPDSVIWGTWLMSTMIFVFAFGAVWMRSRSLLAAILAASLVAFGCRNFISARPATTGFFAISAMWFLVCAIEGQRHRQRIWPLAGMLVLLLAWGCAHGSFIFGYVILAMYAGYWGVIYVWRRYAGGAGGRTPLWLEGVIAVVILLGCAFVISHIVPLKVLDDDRIKGLRYVAPAVLDEAAPVAVVATLLLSALLTFVFWRDRRREPVIAPWQITALLGVLAAAFLLTLIFGPFGWENFVHGKKVGASRVWRSVSEWLPPYVPGNSFPPFRAVWNIFYGIAIGVGLVAITRLALWLLPVPRPTDSPPEQVTDEAASGSDGAGDRPIRVTAFDVLALAIGLIMTFFARRFAPVFLIFAAPVLATWALLMLRDLPRPALRIGRYGVIVAAWVLAYFAGHEAWTTVDERIVAPMKRYNLSLLEQVTRLDATPRSLVNYLHRNDVHGNVVAEWTQGGILMFFSPECRVYMDGRAQQVYDVQHYERYRDLLMRPDTPPEDIYAELDRSQTNLVMMRGGPATANMVTALRKSNDWQLLMLGTKGLLYVRRGSDVFQKLRERAERGEEWRPGSPEALAARGFLWRYTDPPDPQRALNDWAEALKRKVSVGSFCFRAITIELIRAKKYEQARRFIAAQSQRLMRAALPAPQKEYLRKQLNACAKMLRARRSGDASGG